MSDKIAARILDAAIRSLRLEILPQLPDDAARIRLDQITRLLKSVSARLSLRETGLRELLGSAASQAGLASVSGVADVLSLHDMEQHRRRVEQSISERLPDLIDAAGKSSDGVRALARVVQLEKNFFLSQDADIAAGSQVVYRGGRIESEGETTRAGSAPPLNAATLTIYLQRRLQRKDVQAVNVRIIPGGFSKLTMFFTLVDEAAATSADLVIRKDMPLPFIENTVVNEFGLLQKLHGLGFPIAKPMWLETDRAVFGGCFIVSERVAGTSDSSTWAADPVRARAACRALAQVLARLHACTPQQLGYAPDVAALSAGQLMEREIARWSRLFHAKKTEPLPLQEIPIVWLAQNIPQQLYARPARIVHGDVGFHNLMFDETGRVTALLDWEFSILGDTTQDLCFVRMFVEALMPWSEFLELYLAFGGVPPCQQAEFFFALWSKTRNGIGCVDAQFLFDTAMPDEVKFALAGHVFGPYMYIDQCETLVAHLKNAQL